MSHISGAEKASATVTDRVSPQGTETAAETPPAPDLVGRIPVRFGDYEPLEVIARGVMGVVYRARQISLNRIVALKFILSGPFATKQEFAHFRGEAEAAANLCHPNIVPIYEIGEHQGQHFFSMEYVQGRDLGAIVRDRCLAPNSAARYTEAIARAIHYAHRHGILHRDLKPSNVLIDENDQAQITDFGLAKGLDENGMGQVLDSPGFMSPEQALGRDVDRPTDVYGIGGILYCLLTGRAPFQGTTAKEVLRQLHEMDPISPKLLNPGVPRDLDTICLKCLHRDPAKRYQTAEEVAEELWRHSQGEPILAHPVGRGEKIWRWCLRRCGGK